MKNNLLCTPEKRMLWLSQTYESHLHDKRIVDEQAISLPTRITLWQDTSFLGHNPKNVTVKIPINKSRGKDLSDAQKKENRKISSYRIHVKPAIEEIKKCRIVKERFRCRKFGFDDLVMHIVCGLHNFRISLKMCDIELYLI